MAPNLPTRLRTLFEQASHLGWGLTLQLRACRRLGIRELRFAVNGLNGPILVRTYDSDIFDFKHSLIDASRIDLGFSPRVVVDVGANVGYSVLRWVRDYPEARIIALEPEANNRSQFDANCRAYNQVVVEPKALWPHRANLKIENLSGESNAFIVNEDPTGTIEGVSVSDIIDKYDLSEIDLLKIDIEASEIEVFDASSSEWLPKVRALLVETHDRIRAGCSDAVRKAVEQHMVSRGTVGEYEFYVRRD